MEKIEKFSAEVATELKCYVYRLIDPRNGLTFYVGRGKGNRVFAHALDALNNYDGEKYFNSDEEDLEDDTKIKTVREIRRAGLDVIHVIHRYGLDENEAREVESAVIDCFAGLTNKQGGYGNDRGVSNAVTIQKKLSREYYVEPDDINYIIIKTSNSRIEECDESLYEATRGHWKISKAKAIGYKYVLSVINGIVEEVYEVEDWKDSENYDGRCEFNGKVAPTEVREIFIGKRIPANYSQKGSANPILYKKLNK